MAEFKEPKSEYALIAEEINEIYVKDQEMRKRALENNGIIDGDEFETVDQRNTERMKEIVERIGWPTISKVGEDVSNDAWLIVQHADHDVEFQKQCLTLMKAAEKGDVSLRNIAYLEDRVAVNEKRPQIYGTQFWEHDGLFEPRPIEEPDKVDERRKSIGMETLEEYREEMFRVYKK
jgi:hypothetical protein